MYRTAILTAAIAATLAATPALALPSRGEPIASAQLDRIRNWDAPNAETLYVNAQNGSWYEARMASPCWQLPTASRLKIDMASPGTLDSASTVSVGHEHCAISSLSRVDGPRDPLLSKPI